MEGAAFEPESAFAVPYAWHTVEGPLRVCSLRQNLRSSLRVRTSQTGGSLVVLAASASLVWKYTSRGLFPDWPPVRVSGAKTGVVQGLYRV